MQHNKFPRRTFAIISHPDAGKTTLTEKLLLLGGAIDLAGTVKGRKSARHATSDWMALEKKRGISVTTSVMQFCYRNCILNLLDTPGHADFSEDTYRTLTAVDAALMVIDAAKGVEDRTIRLLEVCRLRNTPIITFINKLDRDSRDPIELLDEIERILDINCAPITWPIGMGRNFQGVYNLDSANVLLYSARKNFSLQCADTLNGNDTKLLEKKFGKELTQQLLVEIDLVKGASNSFDANKFTKGKLTPVFFGSALNNFGIRELLDAFVDFAPQPNKALTTTRNVLANENKFSGFVFKIQANMNPQHRDRIAFLRVCSGCYRENMKLFQVRLGKQVKISQAVTFMADSREQVQKAYPGDIIGFYNHGTIQIGDTFTEGENLKFVGIPYFAPELFRLVRLKNPLKLKALQKGLKQLSEEGATQVFNPVANNYLILGAVGMLQFDVVAWRLQNEYAVECVFETVSVAAARWVSCKDSKMLEQFKLKMHNNIAIDGGGYLVYLAPTKVNLSFAIERWPEIKFTATREH